MRGKNAQVSKPPIVMDRHIPAPLGAQLIALRDMALTLVAEVERFKLDSMLDLQDGISLQGVIRDYEIGLIKRALRLSNGNQLRASELLGLKPTTLNAKIKRYDIGLFSRIRILEEEIPQGE